MTPAPGRRVELPRTGPMRGVGALVVVTAIAGACASATGTSEVPRTTQPPPAAAGFYPLDPGWRWAYEVEQEGEKVLATYAVLERLGEIAIVQAGEQRITYQVTPEGIARASGASPPDYLLKNPLVPGAEWPLPGGQARVLAVAESVTVGAGTFGGCVVVEQSRSAPDHVVRTSFAPGVGPVVIEVMLRSGPNLVTTHRARLLGVTPPGADPLAP